ncbi:hypothetical protein HU200_063513 [Digitaria exilis]|uniref:Uncharacterized protein n=1 Tax=Digitaria exilis TaxID=1010633 RepID=A0A835DX64_9POAL|nr:hypothetical protein HU200_063513 [Digitaria exilis]
MEVQQPRGVGNSKVVKVQSEEAWDLFINQASNEGRPVGALSLILNSGPAPSMQVVAHFGASWCVTSLSMNYKFEELAQTHPEVLFLYVDVDDVQVKLLFLQVLCGPFYGLTLGKESNSLSYITSKLFF